MRNIDDDSSKKPSCNKLICDKMPAPNLCLSRVVNPSRRASFLRDRNNTSIQTKPRTTIPLSTVLQLEAAKHKFSTQTVKNGTALSPLCDIVRKYHPGISDCDEEASKVYAKDMYPRLCEPEYKDFFRGIDCYQVKAELKRAYPGSDQPGISHIVSNYTAANLVPQKRCILPWCEPAQPGVSCDEAEVRLDERDKELIDWTTDDDVCHTFLMARNVGQKSSSQKRRKPKVCITPTCKANHLSNKACGKLEDLFEQISKDHGYPEDFTDDDDVCGKPLAARNATLPAVIQKILSKTPTSSTKLAGHKACVLPYCVGFTENACEKAEDLLEQLAKDVGNDVDYTTDEDVCNATKALHVDNSARPVEHQ